MKKELCPDCGSELVRVYHMVFDAPVWLGCKKCKKLIKKTNEVGAYHPTREEFLYPPGSQEVAKRGYIAGYIVEG